MNAQKLKCRDLMVGDWIQNKLGFPMRVIGVGQDYAYVDFEGNEGDLWELDDEDEHPYAIELTGTMLENNGWEAKTWGYSLKYCRTSDSLNNAEPPCLIEYTDSNNLKIFQDYIEGSDVYANILIPIIFVHELQKALRFAGLNHVADNFKI